uniref:Carrier domain-containing protein n=1 Tax=Strigamia maritima TaxID=126957 RepID=T1IUS3_STRMM
MIFIGGRERVCFIDDEEDSILRLMPVFRETGDLVRIEADGEMYFVHRRDSQVKRNGRKVSLAAIEEAVLSYNGVETSAAVFDVETQQIYLFIILKNISEMSPKLKMELDQHLHLKLPSNAIPNTIQQISSLPLTKHGKINSKRLLKLVQNRQSKPESVRTYIEQEWKRLLNVQKIESHDNFISCGGDSIRIIHFAEDLSALTEHPLPQLVDLLLNDTFAVVSAYIDEITTANETVPIKKDLKMDISSDVGDRTRKIVERDDKLIFSKRGGEETIDLPGDFALKLGWRFDLRKCVDASALMVGSTDNSKVRVFIGSHSNEFAAIDVETGEAVWVVRLGGRIESSACVSLCGTLVIVGCYDNFIYCLFGHDGEINWKFQTGSQVKCSPIIDPHSGHVLVGSHDHYLYCIDVKFGTCIWKISPTHGSIFASPSVSKQPHCIYIGTLDGKLCSLNPSNGLVFWEKNLQKPIFASPVVTNDKVFAANVNGDLYCFSHIGKQIWLFSTIGSIFSSPIVIHKKFLMFGCHDSKLYCVLVETGHVHWILQMNSPIYASPFSLFNCSKERSGHVGVIACITGEIKLVSVINGSEIASYTLSGEIFSSPVILKDKLVIGCRDNFVYCFDFGSQSTT